MKKFKLITDFDKEEQFLDDMAQKGYLLEKYNSLGVYTFKKAEPQNLRYKMDYRTFSDKAQFEEYRTLFQDAGWEHVYGTHKSGSQYFLPTQGKAQTDEIFSDADSKRQRYKRFAAQSFSSFAMAIVFILLVPIKLGEFGYLSEGLHNMDVPMFLMALLVSVPLIIARVVAPVVFFLLSILYGYRAIEAARRYK